MLRRRVPAHLRVPLLLATAALTLTGLASAAALVGPDRAGAIVVDAFHGPSAAPASRPMTPVQRARPGTAVVSTRPPATSAERAVPPAAITGQHLPSARPPGSAPPPKALAPPIPPVAPLATLIRPDLLVLSPTQISGPDRDRLTHSSGVQSTLALATGQVQLQQTAVRGSPSTPGRSGTGLRGSRPRATGCGAASPRVSSRPRSTSARTCGSRWAGTSRCKALPVRPASRRASGHWRA